jgi:hypothetical protein
MIWGEPLLAEVDQKQQAPTQIIKRGGGQPLLTQDEIDAGKEFCNQQLDADPAWIKTAGGKQPACMDIIANKIPRLEKDALKHWQTIKRKILQPVLEERRQKIR